MDGSVGCNFFTRGGVVVMVAVMESGCWWYGVGDGYTWYMTPVCLAQQLQQLPEVIPKNGGVDGCDKLYW